MSQIVGLGSPPRQGPLILEGLEGAKIAVDILPRMCIDLLANGPSDGCRVCEVLCNDPHPACGWLLEFHGSDPVRCGIIYGLAAAKVHEGASL